ncbi:MAG: DNA polymerase III subunit beta [Filifactoraceae bacterium]
MKFTVDQKEFNNALNIALKAISSKNILDILRGVLVEAFGNNIILTTNNLEIGIKTSIEANIEKEGSMILDAKALSDMIRKLPEGEVEVDGENETEIKIKAKNAEFNIRGFKDLDFPEVEEIKLGQYQTINPDVLVDLIKKTSFATSIDETKPLLMGELIEIEENSINVVAVDGYRIATKKIELLSTVGKRKVVILGRILVEVMKLVQNSEEEIKIGFDDRYMTFIIGKTTINARTLEGEFINYKQLIPSEFQIEVKVKNKELMGSLERATLVSKKNLVNMKIEEDRLIITAQNEEIGNYKDIIEVEQKGKEIELSFNIRYITEVLRNIDEENVLIKINTNASPCIIKPENDENYTYLILPVRRLSEER